MSKEELTLENVVSRSDDMVASHIDGEVVMMSVEKGVYFGLDLIGSDIWEMLENPVKVSDLIEKLIKKYAVHKATCQKDVLHFLKDLEQDGIIQRA